MKTSINLPYKVYGLPARELADHLNYTYIYISKRITKKVGDNIITILGNKYKIKKIDNRTIWV